MNPSLSRSLLKVLVCIGIAMGPTLSHLLLLACERRVVTARGISRALVSLPWSEVWAGLPETRTLDAFAALTGWDISLTFCAALGAILCLPAPSTRPGFRRLRLVFFGLQPLIFAGYGLVGFVLILALPFEAPNPDWEWFSEHTIAAIAGALWILFSSWMLICELLPRFTTVLGMKTLSEGTGAVADPTGAAAGESSHPSPSVPVRSSAIADPPPNGKFHLMRRPWAYGLLGILLIAASVWIGFRRARPTPMLVIMDTSLVPSGATRTYIITESLLTVTLARRTLAKVPTSAGLLEAVRNPALTALGARHENPGVIDGFWMEFHFSLPDHTRPITVRNDYVPGLYRILDECDLLLPGSARFSRRQLLIDRNERRRTALRGRLDRQPGTGSPAIQETLRAALLEQLAELEKERVALNE